MSLTLLAGIGIAGASSAAGYKLFVAGEWTRLAMRNNENAGCRSWSMVQDFLFADTTGDEPYRWPTHICAHNALQLHNRAEAMGFRCGIVVLDMCRRDVWTPGHVLNVFDCGEARYVDCTCGRGEAKIVPGEVYMRRPLGADEYYPYNGASVKRIRKLWW